MTQQEKRIKLAEFEGWRRWQFGDPWVKGLKLADKQFGGYIRRVIKDAPSDSSEVLLDIDEAWTQCAQDVKLFYTPKSHWTYGNRCVTNVADYFRDLNSVHSLEEKIPICYKQEYYKNLRQNPIEFSEHASASMRCEAIAKTLNLW